MHPIIKIKERKVCERERPVAQDKFDLNFNEQYIFPIQFQLIGAESISQNTCCNPRQYTSTTMVQRNRKQLLHTQSGMYQHQDSTGIDLCRTAVIKNSRIGLQSHNLQILGFYSIHSQMDWTKSGRDEFQKVLITYCGSYYVMYAVWKSPPLKCLSWFKMYLGITGNDSKNRIESNKPSLSTDKSNKSRPSPAQSQTCYPRATHVNLLTEVSSNVTAYLFKKE